MSGRSVNCGDIKGRRASHAHTRTRAANVQDNGSDYVDILYYGCCTTQITLLRRLAGWDGGCGMEGLGLRWRKQGGKEETRREGEDTYVNRSRGKVIRQQKGYL